MTDHQRYTLHATDHRRYKYYMSTHTSIKEDSIIKKDVIANVVYITIPIISNWLLYNMNYNGLADIYIRTKDCFIRTRWT